MVKWVYDKATSEFVWGGATEPPVNLATHAVAAFEEHQQPDPRTDRHDGTRTPPKRLATAGEIASYDAARIDDRALSEAEQKALKAVLLVVREVANDLDAAYRALLLKVNEDRTARGLASVPATTLGTGALGQLTTQDLKDTFLAVWKALP